MKTLTLLSAIIFAWAATVNAQTYQWAKNIGSINSDYDQSIAVDASGNSYIAGYFSGTADFDPGAGIASLTSVGFDDIFFAKYDANGNYLWAKNIGSASNDWGYSITVDASGNCYITGLFQGSADFDPSAGTASLTSVGSGDIFFAKYDANGNYLWAKNIGSAINDWGYSITVDASGNCYITGYFEDTADFDPGAGTANLTAVAGDDIFFAKYDANGNYLWAKNIGSASNDFGYSIVVDASGNCYITGLFQGSADFDPGAGTAFLTPAGGFDIFFAKYDANGNYLWAKNIGSATSNDCGYSIAVDAFGNCYITGYFQGTADFDPGAGTASLTVVGFRDIFFAKYDANGNYLWAKNIGSTGDDRGFSIAVDDSGNTYITGLFTDTADFDPGVGIANLTSAGLADIFFAKYDNSGNYLWAKSIGSTGDDYGYSIAVDGSRNTYITGWFQGTADFDSDTGTANLSSVGGADIFFAKYSQCNTTSSFTPSATTICESETVALTNTSTSATTYQWLENGVPFSTATDTSRTFNTAGAYTISLIADSAGCSDSSGIVITVNPTYTINDPAIYICNGDSVMIYGVPRYIAGTYYDLQVTVSGCDSVRFTTLNVNPVFALSDPPVSVCTGDSTMIYGTYRTAAGTYYNNFTTVNGCDSVHTTVLTVNPAYSISDPAVAICTGDSTMIYGMYRTTAGTYYNNLTTVSGCDSIHSTTLTVNQSAVSSQQSAICSGDSVFLQGNYQTTSGTYYDTLIAANGCDSVHSTVLEVNPIYIIADPAAAICTGDSALIYGTYRTTAGTYYDNLMTIDGCDSIHSTTLTVNQSAVSSQQSAICSGDSVFLQGNYQTTSGTYYDTLIAANGCDSVHSTVLTVNPTYSISDPAVAICSGDSALIYGTYRTSSGTYFNNLITIDGCDSIHSTALTINPAYSISDPAVAICTGDSALIYGTYRTTAGTYYDNLMTIDGCDSIHSTTLTVNQSAVSSQQSAICSGDSVFLQGNYQTTSGTYYDTLIAANGCDSIHSTNLTVNPVPFKPTINQNGNILSSTTANSYQWFFNGDTIIDATSQFYTAAQSGLYSVKITDTNGCSAMSDQFSVTVSGVESLHGVENFDGLMVYPNPNTGMFHIEIHITQPENIELKITNNLGQIIFKEKLKQFKGVYEKQLELKEYPAGIYNLLLVTDKGIINKQIIINR